MQNNVVPKNWLFHNWICQLVCFGACVCMCCLCIVKNWPHPMYFLRGFSFCGACLRVEATKNFEIMYSGFVRFFSFSFVYGCVCVCKCAGSCCSCFCLFSIFIIDFCCCCCLLWFPFIDKTKSGFWEMRQSRRRTIWFRCSYGINRLAHTYYNENNNDNNNKPNHKLTIQFTLVTMLARSLIQFLMLKWETKFYLFVHAVHHSAIMAFFICKVRWSKSTMNNRISVIYFISIFIFLAVFVSFTCFLFVNNQLKALCATRYRKRSYYIFFWSIV